MRYFLPWFVTAVLLATTVTACASERLAGSMAAELDSEVRQLRAEASALREENAQLQWQAACAKSEPVCAEGVDWRAGHP
jgi:outer membrane murein-binding lipoprotein Lpp